MCAEKVTCRCKKYGIGAVTVYVLLVVVLEIIIIIHTVCVCVWKSCRVWMVIEERGETLTHHHHHHQKVQVSVSAIYTVQQQLTMESLPRVAAGRGQPTSTSLSVESLNNSEGDAESMSLVLLEQLRNGVITVNDVMVEELSML
jgi:hypothetical protein